MAALDILPPLFPEAAQLADYMSDISESFYCAGWLIGLEYVLWNAVVSGPRAFGQGRITPQQIGILKTLSAACGGWVAYTERGQIWVPLAEWERHVAAPGEPPLEGNYFGRPPAAGPDRPLYALPDLDLPGSLKLEALLFDKIVAPRLGYPVSAEDQPDEAAAGLLTLVSLGIVIPSTPVSTFYVEGDAEKELAARIAKCAFGSFERDALHARLAALQLDRKHGASAFPVYKKSWETAARSQGARERAIRVTVNRMPVPLPEVSWEQIAACRQDPASRGHFQALRSWVSGVADRTLSPADAPGILQSVLAGFEAHLTSHRLRFSHAPFGAVVCADEDRVDELATTSVAGASCRFDAMGDSRHLGLLESELTAPGREIAYISVNEAIAAG